MGNSSDHSQEAPRPHTTGTASRSSRNVQDQSTCKKSHVVAWPRQRHRSPCKVLFTLPVSQARTSRCTSSPMGLAYQALAAHSHRFCRFIHGKDVFYCRGCSLQMARSLDFLNPNLEKLVCQKQAEQVEQHDRHAKERHLFVGQNVMVKNL